MLGLVTMALDNDKSKPFCLVGHEACNFKCGKVLTKSLLYKALASSF